MIKEQTKFKETEIGPIPEEWDVKKLGEIVNIRRGSSPRPIQNFLSSCGMPWVKISDATADNSRYINTTKQYIKEDGVTYSVVVNPGDFILSNSATPGLPKIMKIKACVHDGWLILKLNEKFIDKLFLYYKLIADRTRLVNFANGAVFDNLKTDIVRDHLISLPLIAEQKRIAEILSSLDDKIELNRKINTNLEKFASSLFKEWFVNFEFSNEDGKPYKSCDGKMVDSELGEIPEGWKVSVVGKEFETFLGGTPSRAKDEYWTNGTVPWINSGMVNEYRITEASEYITEEAVKNSATKLLPKGTVVIAITGATLGQYSLLEIDSSFNQSVVGIKENKNLRKEFIYYWIATTINTLINAQTGGAQQHINKQVVDSHKILIPDQNTLDKYYETVGPIFEFISSNCFEVKNLSALRNYLLPQLMSGKIRVK